MKFRFVFSFAVGMVVLLAIISLIFSQTIKPLLPGNIKSPLLIFVAAIGGVMVFLALFKDILELAERFIGKKKFGSHKYDVYISNSHTDQQFVEGIVNNLQMNNVNVWLTEQKIIAGQLVENELKNAMQKSKSAVFFIGQRGITNWQEKELNWAISENIHIIPVLLPGIPFSSLSGFSSLRDRFTIQFTSINDTQAFNNLLKGIKET